MLALQISRVRSEILALKNYDKSITFWVQKEFGNQKEKEEKSL